MPDPVISLGSRLSTADIGAIAAQVAATIGNTWSREGPAQVVYPAGGIVTTPGSVLYAPIASVELVRGFIVQAPAANPIVGAGGAANLFFGVLQTATAGVASLLGPVTIARINGLLLGSGTENASALEGSVGAGTVLLAKADALFPGSSARALRVWTDVGTASGTLWYGLERHVVIP